MKLRGPDDGNGGGGGDAKATTTTDATATTETKAITDTTAPPADAKAGEQSMLDAKAAAETKDAKAETKAPAFVDEKWEPGKPPEGITRDAEAFGGVKKLFGDLKLTHEQAQKLVEYADSQTVEAGQFLEKRSADWLGSIKADKELGGAKFSETKEHFQSAVRALGGPELADFLKSEKLENAVPIVRALVKAGRLLTEDKVKDTVVDPAAASQNEADRRIAKTYGNNHKES